MASFEELMDSGKYSDLTIKCGDQEFRVHRAIVCSRSKPLAAMVDGNWKESEIGVIELNEDPPEMVKKMIQFLYTLQYDDNRGNTLEHDVPSESHKENPETAEGPLLTNAHLFVLGDIYDIHGLREYARSRYEEIVKDRWNNEFFSQSIHLVYEKCTEESLKGVMVQTAQENIGVLLEREEFLQLLTTFADFGSSLLQASVAATFAASEASANSWNNLESRGDCMNNHGGKVRYTVNTLSVIEFFKKRLSRLVSSMRTSEDPS